jgi:hypothetical protein
MRPTVRTPEEALERIAAAAAEYEARQAARVSVGRESRRRFTRARRVQKRSSGLLGPRAAVGSGRVNPCDPSRGSSELRAGEGGGQ